MNTMTMRHRASVAKSENQRAYLLATREPLTTMPVILAGGYYDGETRDLNNRTTEELSFGLHRKGFTVLDRYKRTIDICPQTGRTIFQHVEQMSIPTSYPSLLSKILMALRFHKPSRLVIGA